MLKVLVAASLIAWPMTAMAQNETIEYFTCVENNALALGKDNTEPADTVLRAAYSECEFEHKKAVLKAALREAEAGLRPSAAGLDRTGDRLRETAGDRATAALLKARASE